MHKRLSNLLPSPSIIDQLRTVPLAKQIVVAVAVLMILALRAPDSWLHPQFWAEDGAVFFAQAQADPIQAFSVAYAGYWHVGPRLAAAAAAAAPVNWAPLAMAAAGAAIVGITAGLVASPRSTVPGGAFMAILIVLAPHDGEIFANSVNMQWFMAISLFILPFLRPPETRWGGAVEAFYVVVCGLSGPFSILLSPIYGALICFSGQDPVMRRRRVLLTATLACSAAAQIAALATLSPASPEGLDLSWRWFGVPLLRVVGYAFADNRYWRGLPVPVSAALAALLAGLALSAWRRVWLDARTRLFAAAVMAFIVLLTAAGLTRFKHDLAPLLGGGDRYFIIQKIMLGWVLALSFLATGPRRVAAGLLLLFVVAGATRFQRHYPAEPAWSPSAAALNEGRSVAAPILPVGWRALIGPDAAQAAEAAPSMLGVNALVCYDRPFWGASLRGCATEFPVR